MNPPAHFEKYPDLWIKIWIGIGVLCLILMYAVMLFIQAAFDAEQQRFADCQTHKRTDCQTSAFWILNDWSMADGVGPVAQPSAPANQQTATTNPPAGGGNSARAYSSSLNAPHILSVTPDNMSLDSGWYRASVGTKVTVTAVIQNAKSADLYLYAKGSDQPLAKKIAGFTSDNKGTYTANFTVTSGLMASLEVRAYGASKDDLSSLTLNVAALP
jgi:hypothetical protein